MPDLDKLNEPVTVQRINHISIFLEYGGFFTMMSTLGRFEADSVQNDAILECHILHINICCHSCNK